MSLDNFRNRTILWDTVNKDLPQPIQIMQGDVNARTLLIKIVDNGTEIDLTGHSLKLTYQYTNDSNSGFIVVPPKDSIKGEFVLVIPTEMTAPGVIEANLILLNKDKDQAIVSKNLTFISDSSTVSDLAQEVNNKIDDFTKLLLENMPQALHSELNDLHAQTDSNKSNIELKANQTDLDNLQATVDKQGVAISTKAEQSELSITNKNVTTIQETAKQAETEAKNAMAKATEAQANSLPLNGNAVSASKLETARKLGVNLQASAFQNFDGTADATDIGVSGVLPIANGGTSTSDGVINTTAYANSADGTDGFTTVYPNLNVLVNSSAKTKDGFFKSFDKVENGYGEVTIKGTNTWFAKDLRDGFSVKPRDYKPNDKYTMSMDVMFTSWDAPAGTTISGLWIGQRYTSGGGIDSWKRICTIDLPKDPSKMLNQWIRITQTSTIPPYEDSAVGTQAAIMAKFTGPSEGSFTIRVRKPKLEQGPIATPWMPSSSEVTTADWPKYIGYSNTLKINKVPTDFTWFPIADTDLSSLFVHKLGDESIESISVSGSFSSKIVSRKIESSTIKHTFVRTGNTVTLTTETKSVIDPTISYDIPPGYRPFNDGTDPIYEQVLSGGKSATISSSDAKWQPRASSGLDARSVGTTSWPTSDSFPVKFPINRYKPYIGQDGAKVGNEYWLFGGSSPDHRSTDYIHRIDPTSFREIGIIKHNLGHANGVDYRDNALLVFNGSAYPPEINLYKNPDNEKTELRVNDHANTQIIFKEGGKRLPGDGSACFGVDKKTVYYSYTTGRKQVVILKILLGLGNNDLSDKTTDKSDNKHWGSFVSGKSSDDYNGTAQVIASYTGDILGDNQPQGMAFNGDLYLGVSMHEPKAYQLRLLDNGRFKVVDMYNAETTDDENRVIPLEPEITLIDPVKRRLFIGSSSATDKSLSNVAEFTLY